MEQFGHHHVIIMLLGIGTLLVLARALGELARHFNQPSVLGELFAGILLGPTILGNISPDLMSTLFPSSGPNFIVLKGLTTLAVVLFLLVAGMELDLSTVIQQGRSAAIISLMGILFPFTLGFGAAWFGPLLFGAEPGSDRLLFAMFFATALSITALPVIAKTLMDLNIYRSDLGALIIASAIVDDLAGWIIFATILGMMGTVAHLHSIPMTIAMTIGYAAFMLTIGRMLLHRILPWLQAYLSWPGGVLGFALSLALFGAAFTEWIGVHAIFGSFMIGVAIGDSSHLREKTRATIDRFVSFFFAPVFFAYVGMQVNFAAAFDPTLILAVIAIACAGKIIGCTLGGRLAGMLPREALALGFAMNSRGMMEIILGHLAFQHGLIGERMFVALVVMAIVTSMMCGPIMQRLLKSEKPRRFIDYLTPKTFLIRLKALERREAIRELAAQLHGAGNLSADQIVEAVIDREEIMATGISGGMAVPHARVDGLKAPLVCVGLSEHGVDFDAPDGEVSRLIFLILTPRHDGGAQLQILSDIARTFREEQLRERLWSVATYTEFLALLKSEQPATN